MNWSFLAFKSPNKENKVSTFFYKPFQKITIWKYIANNDLQAKILKWENIDTFSLTVLLGFYHFFFLIICIISRHFFFPLQFSYIIPHYHLDVKNNVIKKNGCFIAGVNFSVTILLSKNNEIL